MLRFSVYENIVDGSIDESGLLPGVASVETETVGRDQARIKVIE